MIAIIRTRHPVFTQLTIGWLLAWSAQVAEGAGGQEHGRARAEPATAEGALDAFHHALEEGDGQAALRWLADDAVILEGGVSESKEEYAAHHLDSDMAFLAEVQSDRLSREIRRADGVVTVITRARLTGALEDRKVDLVSSETAVLKQIGDEWRIQHLHWSS